MAIIDPNHIDGTLDEFFGQQFTTLEFIQKFRSRHSDDWYVLEQRFGEGGSGSGRFYTAYNYIGLRLKDRHRNGKINFVDWISAPAGWGNPVIALWSMREDADATIQDDSLIEDIRTILADPEIEETEKETVIISRIGQSDFRRSLITYWGQCSITGCRQISILRASHIKPWRLCNNEERLDLFNGLLLTPNLDVAFDQGLISFDDEGTLIMSPLIIDESAKLGISNDMKLRKIETRHKAYLQFHRENIFQE